MRLVCLGVLAAQPPVNRVLLGQITLWHRPACSQSDLEVAAAEHRSLAMAAQVALGDFPHLEEVEVEQRELERNLVLEETEQMGLR